MAIIDGTGDGEVLVGTADDDVISGLGGDDFLFGDAGDDVLDGGAGFDRAEYAGATARVIVDLGAGEATGDASVGEDTLISIEGVTGTDFNDLLFGFDGDPGGDPTVFERFEGLAGVDIIDGRGGIDLLSHTLSPIGVTIDLTDTTLNDDGFGNRDIFFNIEGVEGSDFGDRLRGDANANVLLGGDGDDNLNGAGGDDQLDGGAGIDVFDASAESARVIVDLDAGTATGGAGGTDTLVNIENVLGSDFNDILTGDDAANELRGDVGADTLRGGGNADRLIGQGDNDILFGDAGDDQLFGNAGDDQLSGGLGDDQLSGGDGGFDTATYAQAGGGIVVDFASLTIDDGDGGTDRIVAIGGVSTIQQIVGSGFDDIFTPGEFVTFNGAGGSDSVDLSGLIDVADVNLNTGEVREDGVLIANVFNVEEIIGTDFADDIVGNFAANTLNGGLGNDILEGDGGADVINGGAGDDVIIHNEGDGSDDIDGGVDADVLEVNGGGAGGGEFRLQGNGLDAILQRFDFPAFTLNIAGVETLDFTGQTGGDTFEVDALGNATLQTVTFNGGAGDDTLNGADADTDLLGLGGAGDDFLIGGAGFDQLQGGANDDILRGGADDDDLDGGAGTDTADYADALAGIVVDMVGLSVDDGLGGTDTLTSIERIQGSNFDDLFLPGQLAEFDGRGGVDAIDLSGAAAGLTVDMDAETVFDGGTLVATLLNVETVIGGVQNDTILGNDLDNNFTGDAGDDLLVGRGGDDVLEGEAGDDTFVHNEGDGSDTLIGGADNDTVEVNGAADTNLNLRLDGNGADATLQRFGLNAFVLDIRETEALTVQGDAGNDVLDVNDLTGSVLQSVVFNGGAGDDELAGEGATTALIADGEGGDDVLEGGGADDELSGGDDDDTLRGGLGADRLIGEGGDDILEGGDGVDRLFGNGGADDLNGGDGDDIVSGASGDDVIRNSAGDDTLDGGAGSDVADLSDALAAVTFDAFNRTIQDGLGGTDTIVADADGGSSIEGVIGSDFDDLFLITGPGRIDGGSGVDTLDLSNGASGFNVNLVIGLIAQEGRDDGTVAGVESIVGSGFDDVFRGSDVGDDLLNGGGGDDRLIGREGDDTLIGGLGDDTLDGRGGLDTADYSAAGAAIFAVIRDGVVQDGDGGVDTLIGVESIVGSAFGDIIAGSRGDDLLIGGAGVDRINGLAGADEMRGGADSDLYTVDNAGDRVVEIAGEGGADRILSFIDIVNADNVEELVGINEVQGLKLTGNAGAEIIHGTNIFDSGDIIDGKGGDDRLVGRVGDDILIGGAGDDTIFGNSGDDLILGANGDDRLIGQFGADTFIHRVDHDADIVQDFDLAEDFLDLTDHDFANFGQVQALMSDVGGNAFIDLQGADSLTLLGIDFNAIQQGNVLI